MTQTLTIVGGGIGGLTTAIAAAEQHVKVELFEASERLGGQAWTLDGPFRANWGPHVIYSDGPWWTWLKERNLTCEAARFPAVPKLKVRYHHTTRRFPPVALIRSLIKLRRATAPTDTTFIQWAATIVGDEHAQALANLAQRRPGSES